MIIATTGRSYEQPCGRRAVKVTVKFNDDHEEMNGTVIGTDPDRDLAVIRVNADD